MPPIVLRAIVLGYSQENLLWPIARSCLCRWVVNGWVGTVYNMVQFFTVALISEYIALLIHKFGCTPVIIVYSVVIQAIS